MIWLVGEKKEFNSEILNELYETGLEYRSFQKISEAYAEISMHSPMAIVIDSDSSEIATLELCIHLKSSHLFRKPYLIILSGNETESIEVSMLDAGADEFVLKPLRKKAFVKKLSIRLRAPEYLN